MDFYIKKSSGELQRIDLEKFRQSLLSSGADKILTEKIIDDVKQDLTKFTTTKKIHGYAYNKLRYENPAVAARYNLKSAIIEFGPTGYPFEQYVAKIFEAEGYETKLDQIVNGSCITHEIDIIIKKNNENYMVECKFHNNVAYKSDVQVPLYTDAKFHDIAKIWMSNSAREKLHKTWIFTNTRFSEQALQYANCVGIRMTSWDYPKENNLKFLIAKYKLHPITALTSLTRKHKKFLVQNGLVLCRDVAKNEDLLKKLKFNQEEIDKIVHEAELIGKI